MTHLARLFFLGAGLVGFLLCSATPVSAQGDITLVSRMPAELMDAQALRAALESELQVPTVLRDAASGPTLLVEAETLQSVRVSFLRPDKPSVERTLDVSTQPDHVTGIVALLASNLVRDEAGELLAQLSAAKPPAIPVPPAPKPKAKRPYHNDACKPNNLRSVVIGADFVPGLGTSMRQGTKVERMFSFNLIGGITGGVNGAEFAGVFNIDRYTLCGAQFAGTFNFVGGDAMGAQFSSVNIVSGSFLGAQFSQANILGGDLLGAQFGMLNLTGGRATGGQFGLINFSGQDLDGAQLGLVNIAGGDFDGAQLGLVNIAGGDSRGAQLGLVNLNTQRMRGAMVGLVNIAEDADAAVGLVNVIWNGRAQLDVWGTDAGLIMAGATQGAKFTHNIYGLGLKPMGDTPAFATALGFGVRVFNASRLTVDIDAVTYGLMRKNPDSSRVDFATIHQIRVPVSLKLLPGVWVFVAPSVSVSVAQLESHMQKVALFGSQRLTKAENDTTVRIFAGASVGARFF